MEVSVRPGVGSRWGIRSMLRFADRACTRERRASLNRNAFRSAAPCTLICTKVLTVVRRAGLDLREVGRPATGGTNRQQEWIDPLFLQDSLPGWAGPVSVATDRSAHSGEADVAGPSPKRRA